MKIALTGDTHVHWFDDGVQITNFIKEICGTSPDALVHVGDIGEGMLGLHPGYELLLNTHPNTMFVLGNHDLWRKLPMTPPLAFRFALQRCQWGKPLEKEWEDKYTVLIQDDCAFVGSIGFPDFAHPQLANYGSDFWDNNCATNDAQYIDVKKGWLAYTLPLQEAFFARLKIAFLSKAKNIIVVTHYPIFESQCRLTFTPEENKIWPFFFNWTIGQEIKRLAAEHPDKNIYCFAGHSHEYCSGRLTMVSDNIFTFGLIAMYGHLKYKIFDTNEDIVQQMERINLVPR